VYLQSNGMALGHWPNFEINSVDTPCCSLGARSRW
jgi:hypothetical protein